jgi:hypothetical protein
MELDNGQMLRSENVHSSVDLNYPIFCKVEVFRCSDFTSTNLIAYEKHHKMADCGSIDTPAVYWLLQYSNQSHTCTLRFHSNLLHVPC